MVIFFLSGCSEPTIVYKYKEKPVPKFKILNKVEFYQVIDYRSYDDRYWLINKKEFDIASARVIKKDHKIQFYEKWGIRYNNIFVTKETK